MTRPTFEIFLAAPPGLEPLLRAEAEEIGLRDPRETPGGVLVDGDWPAVRRANLALRGAGRVLARVGAFPAAHLAQLDKRARALPWGALLRSDVAVVVEAVCRKSKIYHSGAAAERVARAIEDAAGAPAQVGKTDLGDPIGVAVRIERDFCTISLDTSGAPLHRRGFKQAVGRAPMRETLAALFLRACAWRPGEPLIDPMCGSGTFLIEASEIAAGMPPGRSRAFAFERLAGHDPAAWAAEKAAALGAADQSRGVDAAPVLGFDRDAGAVAAAVANAARAGVADRIEVAARPISALAPADPRLGPGLVIVNPPYGARIGEAGDLRALYGALGQALRAGFSGWRVGLVTSEPRLAQAAGLPFGPPGPPTPHGALRIRLHQTGPLP